MKTPMNKSNLINLKKLKSIGITFGDKRNNA
jgi:hypothetical protein